MTEDDLRDASLGLQLYAVTGLFGSQLRAAVAAQTYQVQASAMGVSPEEAARVLGEVITELSQTGASGDAYDIAWHRLAAGENLRPPEQFRDAARELLGAHGYSIHPEAVDAEAWHLQHVMAAFEPRVPWYKRWWRRLRNALRRKAK